ncbi:hypothetical protein JCM10450v2_006906 [Rhodotorula kratochvilovae]
MNTSRPSSFAPPPRGLGSLRRQGPPFSSLRERPLSVASTLSAVSIASIASTSSSASALTNTGERRRRSAALLELDVDDMTRSSLLRAEEVLRASEQDRERDRRRSRLSWRERQARSAHFIEDLGAGGCGDGGCDDETEELACEEAPSYGMATTLKRFSPKRLLRKTRSIPSELLLSPKQQSRDGATSQRSPTISAPRRMVKSPSPPKPAVPRRAVSAADLLSNQPTVVRHVPRPASPPQHQHYGTLPLRFSHLPLPHNEPQSKFSASSGDSIVHVVSFGAGAEGDKRRRGFKDRARTFSQASTSGLKSLKGRVGKSRSIRDKTVKKQSSLANLFSGIGAGSGDDSTGDKDKQRAISFASASRAPVASGDSRSGHRPSTSISSYAPSSAPTTTSDSAPPSRKPSRLGFFRSTHKRDSASSKRNSIRTRSSGQISPSLISRPVSASTSEGFSPPVDKRFSEVSTSSEGSAGGANGEGKGKGGWASRLSKAVKGKNVAAKKAMFESGALVQRAEKVKVPSAASPNLTARAPSRIPLATVFPLAAPPARPPRPSKNLESSDDTTFYGHRIPAVKSRAAALDALAIQTSAPRVRPKTSIPVARARVPPPVSPLELMPSTTYAPLGQSTSLGVRSGGALLPPAPIYPAHSFPNRRYSPDSFDTSDSSLSPAGYSSPSGFLSSSDEDDRCPSPARSFRSPSPARFRDLLPSLPAGSSPEKNERGLPVPQEASPKSASSRDSPRKRAMGPEQVILMEDAKQPQGPITEVRGATTDLADLLSGLEDTEDLHTTGVGASTSTRSHIQQDVSDLSASLRGQLPHVDSIESLRSSISDVPFDLKRLISAVDDHISEVDVPHVLVEQVGMAAHGFADEESDSSSSSGSSDDDEDVVLESGRYPGGFLSVVGEHTTGVFGSDGGPTHNFDATASTFEGHFTTAAAALRSMLSGPEPSVSSPPESATLQAFPLPASATIRAFPLDEIEEEELRSYLRDSVREALELGRPSNGAKMFDEVDMAVSLTALVHSPSPPDSPEQTLAQAREQAFLRNHLRSNSAVSSTEGSAESFFSLMGSPTPLPSTGRPLRQSLARYSQDRFPLKRPSHRARPISEQSSVLSSEQDQPSNEPTSMSVAAPSSRSTNLSISSITSSPCPAPQHRRIPMLTRNLPPPMQPAFRFPPVKPAEAQPEWVEQRGDGEPVPLIKASTSPRYVRPLHPPSPGEPLPRPRPLDLDGLDGGIVPPDTPPPSSPSDSERHAFSACDSARSSFEVEQVSASTAVVERKSRHARQTSRSSSIMQSVIVEEAESPTQVNERVRQFLQPLSPIQEPPSPQSVPRGPFDDSPSVRIELAEAEHFSTARVIELDTHEDFDFTAETNPELTSRYFSFSYEAETELKRSVAMWPDTDYSREVIAHWLLPRTYHAILEFIFYSQTRFPSPPHLLRMTSFVPLAYDDPPTPPSPIRIPPPIIDSPLAMIDLVSSTPPSPEPVRRRPLAAKPLNRQVAELSQSTSSPSKQPKEDLSPFTALPPRLSSKLRGLRAKMGSKSPKKAVDTAFLGEKATKRRQGQFEAAMRRLEGVGLPTEQRSDEETDDTGVLEAKGEATEELTFTKTPRLSTSRPKVRRKTALSTLR